MSFELIDRPEYREFLKGYYLKIWKLTWDCLPAYMKENIDVTSNFDGCIAALFDKLASPAVYIRQDFFNTLVQSEKPTKSPLSPELQKAKESIGAIKK